MLGGGLRERAAIVHEMVARIQSYVPGYELVGWTVMYAPKGIPAEASRTLVAALHKTLARPEVQEKLLQMGIEPLAKSGEELKTFGVAEKEKWGRLIKGAGL